MRISDYLQENLIFLDIDSDNKRDAIAKLVHLMAQETKIENERRFLDLVYEREQLGSTAIGFGIALPHARADLIDKIVIGLMRLNEGVDFDAEDGEPVRLIILLGTPSNAVSEYLKVLAKISKLLHDKKTRNDLLKAKSNKELLKILSDAEDQV